MLNRILTLICLLCLCYSEAEAQQYFFRRYSVEEGLPQSTVYCLLQDSRGFIWMGTDGGGLVRFDGTRFETFTKSDGLSDNVIRSLCEDSRGNIWIGTFTGLTLYDGQKFTAFTERQKLSGTSVLKITEGSNGVIWIGTNSNGLIAIQPGDSLKITDFSIDNGLISNFIFDIYEDPAKRIWLAMVGGANILTFKGSDTLDIENIEDPIIPTDIILSVEPGDNGTFWLGSLGDGLFKAIPAKDGAEFEIVESSVNDSYPGLIVWDILDGKNGETWLATDKNGIIRLREDKFVGEFNRDNGLPSNQILGIMEDNEDNTWLASYGQGAIMYSNEKFLSYSASEGVTGNQVLSIFSGPDETLYTATEEGFTSFRRSGDKIQKLKHFSLAQGLNDAGATCIAMYHGNIHIGTNNGINVFNGKIISEFKFNYRLPDRKVNALLAGSNDKLWAGTSGGYAEFSADKIGTMSEDDGLIHNEIQTIIEDSGGRIWIGTFGGLVKLENKIYTDFNEEDGLDFLRINTLAEDPAGNIWIGTFGGGIYKFDINEDSIPISLLVTKGVLSSGTVNSLLFISNNRLIAGTDKGFDLIELNEDLSVAKVIPYGNSDGFTGGENNTNSVTRDKDGMIWFGTKNGMIRFNPSISENLVSKPKTHITSVNLFFEKVDWNSRDISTSKWNGLPENLELSHKENHVTFEYTGLSFSNPDDVTFSYRLERNGSGDWSPFTSARSVTSSDLRPGNYTFSIRAKNKFDVTGDPVQYTFLIKPPFWQTKWFIVLSVLAAASVIVLFIRYREKKLIDEKIKLEKIVEERTREVVEQKDEISRQRDIVTYQKKEITDSIQYAKTIQKAVLPDESILKTHFSGYFILFRPKDIVSGDFYWMTEKGDNIILTAADCTGHGVPGAFMSMLGVSFLNKIINEKGILQPDSILNELRENVVLSLKQKGERETSKDGMDMALCCVDLKNNILRFAGANNPMVLIRKVNNEYEILEKRADVMPVGVYSRMNDFTMHEMEIMKGDTIYLFSDGFCDQFGGPDGRKFMKPRFNKMLLENQGLEMSRQKEVFEKTLDDWINHPCPGSQHIGQIDDIIILGIRI